MSGIWSRQTHRKRTRTSSSSLSCCNLLNREWDNLPLTVVFLILDKLSEPADLVRFGALCKHYHSLAKDHNQAKLHKVEVPLPTLLIRNVRRKTSIYDDKEKTTLFSVFEGKIDIVKLPILPGRRSSYGCGNGWLATVVTCDQGVKVELRHPLRKRSTSIRLPLLNLGTSIGNFILSADPALNPDSYVVGATLSDAYREMQVLAFTRAGQQHWTYIELPRPYVCVNAMFYKSQIYCVSFFGEILSVNFDSNNDNLPEANLYTTLKPFSRPNYGGGYLVESTRGELLYVERFQDATSRVDGFKVYKVVFSDGEDYVIEQLLETSSIGDEAIFLDDKHAVSVSALNYPKCQRNSIYCISKYDFNGMRACVFSIENGTTTQPYPLTIMQNFGIQGVWIMPSASGLF